MLDLKQKLAEPGYLELHLLAASLLARSKLARWYDASFLRNFEIAKDFLAQVRPDVLAEFTDGFAPLRAPADFSVRRVAGLFTPDVHAQIRALVAELKQDQLEAHELATFGRHVVHDHPFLTRLQSDLLPLIGDLAGQQVECGYNFLSLYGGNGRCKLHMDEPISMYTLDYCIDQQGDWPIHFSRVVDWPERKDIEAWEPASVLADPDMAFESHVIGPNEAVLFTGSSQWHYRDPMPAGGRCNLLFFHYYPAGCADLVLPSRWCHHFAIPELVPLCDIFAVHDNEMQRVG